MELRFGELPAERLGAYAGAIDAMYAGRLHGLLVRGLFPPAVMRRAAAALARERGAVLEKLDRRKVPARTYGIMLAPTEVQRAGPALDQYLDRAPEVDALLGRLFPEEHAFEWRLAQGLTALAGRPARRMQGRRPYAPATIRVFAPGSEAVPHCDSYQRLPAWSELREACDLTTQLSAYVPLTTPERGGELVVYALGREDPFDPSAQALALAPRPGDLLVFDAGRLQHRVERVAGRRARRTIGGFAALTHDRSALMYWG